MGVEFRILKDGKWVTVDPETYVEFKGKKERLPSTWRSLVVSQMLLPYRFAK